MSDIFNISHPLNDEPGMSQRRRLSPALDATQNLIDARDLADMLVYIHQFSKQVNFYDFSLEVSNWSVFFEKSAPFILAKLAKQNTDLSRDYREGSLKSFQQYNNLVKNDPTPANFQLLLDFTYRTTLLDVADLYADTKSVGGFQTALAQEISSRDMTAAIRQFIGIANATQYCLGGSSKDFTFLTEDAIWQLDITDIFAQSTPSVLGGKIDEKRMILTWLQGIERFFAHFQLVSNRLSKAAEQHLSESLYPLEVEFKERHEPHLGLLFAFLELFKHLKGQLNGMTAKHLDFYFRQVLKIQSRKAIPDAVHLVLEVQKHVQRQLLKRGVDFRDGKDINGQDILFSLDDEVVINKAQIKSLKTLFVKTRLAKPIAPKIVATETLDVAQNEENNTEFVENSLENATKTAICDPSATVLETYTEGVFIAPVANSADGKGMDFKEPMSKNWATLGRDKSKFVPKIVDGNLEPDNNLFARLGFILASPVLFLQEGVRTITIDLTVSNTPKNFIKLKDFSTQKQEAFKVYLSGEKEWIKVENYLLGIKGQTLRFVIVLDATVEPIVHFNPENLKESYGTTEPLVKFEINQEAKITLDTEGYVPCCCAEREMKKPTIKVSAYHFLKNINVINAKIRVQVSGIKKNIIVQNDENLQDVNGLIYPFGTRPEVPDFSVSNYDIIALTDPPQPYPKPSTSNGSNFYIGSKEIFLKNWSQVNIYLNWKDRPTDFRRHYGAYLKRTSEKSEIDDFTHFGLENSGFKFNAAYLTKGNWKNEQKTIVDSNNKPAIVPDDKILFDRTEPVDAIGFEQKLIFKSSPTIIPTNQQGMALPFTQLKADTREGFMRLTLKNQDFLHKDYPFVLARQMMAFGRLPDKNLINGAIYMKASVPHVIDNLKLASDITKLLSTKPNAAQTVTDVNDFIEKINTIILTPEKDSEGTIWVERLKKIKELVTDALTLPIATLDTPTTPTILGAKGILVPLSSLFTRIRDIIVRTDTIKVAADVKLMRIKALYASTSTLAINENLPAFLQEIKRIISSSDSSEDTADEKIALINTKVTTGGPLLEADLAAFFAKITNTIDLNIDSTTDTDGTIIKNKSASHIKFDDIATLFSTKTDEAIESNLTQLLAATKAFINEESPYQAKFNDIKKEFEADKAKLDHKEQQSISEKVKALADFSDAQTNLLNEVAPKKDDADKALIPNEPWTPIIKNISLDYAAEAGKEDITFIHLYPFEGTYKKEAISSAEDAEITAFPKTTLLPQFLDEGTLFLGFEQLEPSTNVQILFQLAEATADTEGGRADVKWHYLSKNNEWKPLRTGFEILEDATNSLTASGIIKLAIPEDIGDKNVDNQHITQMPSGQFWLKAASANNTRAVCETLGVFTQAVRATARFTEGADTTRLNTPIAAESVAKLAVADASIKQVTQPFDAFGGQIEEAGNQFYLRVSERLRHKGRAATPFDYERLLLEAFPVIYKAKCIPHSLALPANQFQVDLQQAAGFVTVAVIPDLTRLKSGNLTEPRVALHVLDQITAYLKYRTTPFARLKVVNPRYEAVDICFDLKLKKGKDALYYSRQLEEELRLFLAPWSVGDTDKLSFGQPIYYSDILTFIDQRDYVDYVKCLEVDLAEKPRCPLPKSQTDPSVNVVKIGNNAPQNGILRPLTPRSVLVAGKISINIL